MLVPRQSNTVEENPLKLYIIVTTRNINLTTSNVLGTASSFLLNTRIQLNPDKKYTVEIQSLTFDRGPLAVDSYLTVLTDISDEIMVNNVMSSILYKSRYPGTASVTNIQVDNITDNNNFVRPLKRHNIDTIRFQLVNSTDGSLVNYTTEITEMVLLIKEVSYFN